MTFMHFDTVSAIASPAVAAGVVTLSGGTYSCGGHLSGTAGFIFSADGRVYTSGTDCGTVQINPGTDWIIPESSADGTYEIRGTHTGGTATAMFGFLLAGTWYTLDSDRFYGGGISFGGGPPFYVSQSGSALIEIRKDGGAVLSSAIYNNEVYAYDF